MEQRKLLLDPRYFQLLFQTFFLSYGVLVIGWNTDWQHWTISLLGCVLLTWIAESVRQKRIQPWRGGDGFKTWGLSVLISALSLCLLLKTNYWQISLLACSLTVASKYFLRFKGRHLFNPSAFGIVLTIILTDKAWLSPGQWGNEALIFFLVLTLGTIVVTRVQKLDISLAFLLTFVGLLYWRQVLVLGWPADYFIHSISSGGLLLFTFFMISDPKTSPNHPVARCLWAITIAIVAFYLAAFKWKYNTAIYVLVFAAPLVPLLNAMFKSASFNWKPATIKPFILSPIKKIIMKPFLKKFAAVILLLSLVTQETAAFCGFYVSKADGTLKNKTSQVILVRDGNRNVITMYNDFKGDTKDFAMVVPVPVVLKKSDIKVVDQSIFKTLNEYSQPRLVEYYDENPCSMAQYEDNMRMKSSAPMQEVVVVGYGSKQKRSLGVTIEAKYLVGEYDILILGAKESSGLRTWLTENGYKLPDGAEEVLEPYIKSNLKFFVVKVNEAEKKKLAGDFLRPIQITFNSPKFMLPIRLGMANADGDQDLIVYAFTKKGRVESTNYRSTSLPTGNKVPLFVQGNFGNFYSNLFEHQWKKEGKAVVMLEYAWDVSPKNFLKCDPCVATAPSSQDLVQAGVWWLNRNWNDYSDVDEEEEGEEYSDNVYFTRLHVRYNRQSFPQDLAFQVTPNTENYQARYVITHPATGDLTCVQGKQYLKDLKLRRKTELENLAYLTGKGYSDWDVVGSLEEEKKLPAEATYAVAETTDRPSKQPTQIIIATLGLAGLLGFMRFGQRKKLKS